MKYINELPNMIKNGPSDKMDNIDERYGFVNNAMIGEEFSNNNGMYFDPFNLFSEAPQYSLLPYDLNGNIRVLRMYWKSRRKIKRVKTYDPQSGEEDYHFYTEDYICDESKGEEEEIFWVNEAWEGTKIDIFTADFRLYNALVHNNALNIGLSMKDVKMPIMTLEAPMWLVWIMYLILTTAK